MKKFLSVVILSVIIIFSTAPVQAESFDFVPLSSIYSGRVVNIKTYLSIRERPNVNSREVMRIFNGDRLELREDAPGWWQVLSVNGNNFGRRAGVAIGYVNANYVQTDW